MSVLRDYIAYAKETIHPKLSDEASQRLIQCYVDMRKAGKGRGQITAYPRQLESLIRLSEAHAKVRLSEKVELSDVEEAFRLHREAIKQSATDPHTGKIDLGIITTGVSNTGRKRKAELAQQIRRLIESKGRVQSLSIQKIFLELKENSSWVSLQSKLTIILLCFKVSYAYIWLFSRELQQITKEMYEDVLNDLQEEGMLNVTKTTLRLCRA